MRREPIRLTLNDRRPTTLAGRAAGAAACVTLVLRGPAATPLWDWLNHVHAAGKDRTSPDAQRIDYAVFG